MEESYIPTSRGRDVQEKERRDCERQKKKGMGLQLALLYFRTWGVLRRCESGSRSVSVADVKVWMKSCMLCVSVPV
jgi:hypothetical protein